VTRHPLLPASALLIAGLGVYAQAPGPRFSGPEGFVVEEVYAPDKSGSVVAIAFDSRGRLVIGREDGPVVRLVDENGDGRPDREQVITAEVTNCQGIEFDGDDLLAVGKGPTATGLHRVSDTDGDGVGDRVTLLQASSDHIQEHGPHDVFYGPDGWVYWILGNFTGIVATADPLSPHRWRGEAQLLPVYFDPRGHATQIRAPGGTVYRRDLSKDGSDWQRVTGGFRNAYDASFNLDGELFTFDSDMEWDINLPWYRPVRTYHVPPGAEFGWRTGSGVWPEHYPDALPALTNVGRGSPTGVAFYQSHSYPARYRDAFLQADWSRGRILVGFLTRKGATYAEESKDFVLGTPLNVTDIEIGPDGSAYFSKGGRKTEGGIYRVLYRGADAPQGPKASSWLEAVLTQAQPRSAWGRASIRAQRTAAGAAWAPSLLGVARSAAESADRRVRALELMQVYGPPLDVAALAALAGDANAEVRAAAAYHLGLHATDDARSALALRLADVDPFVRRRAAEALVRTGVRPGLASPRPTPEDVLPLLDDPDRFVRYAARELLIRIDRNRWRDAALKLDRYPAIVEGLVALSATVTATHDVRTLLAREAELIAANPGNADLAGLLRAIHLTIIASEGVDYEKAYLAIGESVLARFPSGDEALDRELARSLAYLKPPGAIAKLTAGLQAPNVSREQSILYAFCLQLIPSGWEPAQRAAMIQWFKRTETERWKGGSSFGGYIFEIWEHFLETVPEPERQAALAAVPSMAPGAGETTQPPWRRNENATFSEQELKEYLEFDPMAYLGNADRGRKVYEKAFCINCHRFGDAGTEAGPDLTDVARRFRRKDVLDAILYPSRTISDQWAAVEFVTKKKQSVVGVITNETADAVLIRTVAGQPMKLPKADIASRTPATVSAMPEGLLNGLRLDEVRDLLTFLEKGAASQ
jgi:putative heme-binding domain-containing protein